MKKGELLVVVYFLCSFNGVTFVSCGQTEYKYCLEGCIS